MKTIAAVCEELGLNTVMKEPERWLLRQITSGRITARKIGRTWMFTDDDVAHALEVFANRGTPTPRSEDVGQPSRASVRRRLTVAQ